MSVNARSKGRSFEQAIALDLRASLDGWTVTRNQTDRQGGQVEGVAGEFTITRNGVHLGVCIECKAVESFDAAQLWREYVPDATAKLWRQAARQADGVRQIPMLIVKRNRREVLCMMRSGDAVRLMGLIPVPCMYVEMAGTSVTVMRWADVVKWARWAEVEP